MKDDPRRSDDCNDDAVCNHGLCSSQARCDDHGVHDAHGIECSFHDRHERFHASQRSPFLQKCRRREAASEQLT